MIDPLSVVPMLPIHQRTVGDMATDALRHAILSGRYRPGERLIEKDLTKQLNVRRGPVRDALRRLAGEGLVRIEAHRGATVIALSRDRVRNIFEMREVLEGLAARLGAERIREGDNLAKFNARLRDGGHVLSRTLEPALLDENQRFHQAIIESSGNDDLIASSVHMQFALCRLRIQGAISARIDPVSKAEHAAIVEAIRAGDGAMAEKKMRAHVRRTLKLIQSLPDEQFRIAG